MSREHRASVACAKVEVEIELGVVTFCVEQVVDERGARRSVSPFKSTEPAVDDPVPVL
jgi:hypothetical protein